MVKDDVSEAQLHLRDCECCQEYFRQDEALLHLYAKVREVPAPLSVRQRVYDALAAARWGARSEGPKQEAERATSLRDRLRKHGAWPLAMAALLAVVFFGELRGPRVQPEPSAVFVEDYLRRAVGQEHIESNDPREVRRFLERELGLTVEPLRLTGFDLARAEICLLEGRRGAMIVYKGSDGDVSHYLVPRKDAAPRRPAVSTAGGGEIMPVVTWASSDVEQALVGELDAERLLEIATGSLH